MENRFVKGALLFAVTLGFFSLFGWHLPRKIIPASPPASPIVATIRPESNLQTLLENLPETEASRQSLISSALPETERSVTEIPTLPAEPKQVQPIDLEAALDRHALTTFTPLGYSTRRDYGDDFPMASSLERNVEFWRNVFAGIESTRSLIHDARHLEIIFGELDFSDLYEEGLHDLGEIHRVRSAIEEKRKGEIADLLSGFHEGRLPVDDFERSLFNAYDHITERQKFKKAAERVRSQWGMKEKLRDAIIRFGRYEEEMENIFRSAGVPPALAKLTFVESMFNTQAVSKVGASGPYQFMPKTAQRFLLVDEVTDERLDPLISGWAASQLLLANYERLGSWPLAMNAYNSGPGRLEKAVRQLGTRDIARIIRDFDGEGYGFASRNFYPEFLAILDVTEDYRSHFGELLLNRPVPFDEILVSHPTSIYELAQITATGIDILRDLNPAFAPGYFEPFGVVPPGYTIRVPEKQRAIFLSAAQLIQDRQQEIHWHLVGESEDLKSVALRYQVPTETIAEANGLIGPELRKGQILKIPGHESRVVLETLP